MHTSSKATERTASSISGSRTWITGAASSEAAGDRKKGIFLALGIKAAFPLLHNWLTDAYPEATPSGTVFLSAFTTKVAVYALARAFPGTDLLIWVGVAMTAFPIFYAVIENDLRRVLSYSMINQIGFMVVGIGLGTALSINGAVAHAFNDVIFKGLTVQGIYGRRIFETWYKMAAMLQSGLEVKVSV